MDDKIVSGLLSDGMYEQVFNMIMKEYRERLYLHIRRMGLCHDDTDDILQNTFIKIWTGLPSFREESRLFTWIYRIATNETISWLNKKRLKSIFSLEIIRSKPDEDQYFDGDKLQKALYEAIAKLPPKQRTVFNMRYFDDMKYEDIAEITGGSVGSLKASYHHAYNKIRNQILNLQQ